MLSWLSTTEMGAFLRGLCRQDNLRCQTLNSTRGIRSRWRHGLTAKMIVIAGEDANQFEKLRADLIDEHDRQSALECELVERLAGILWRLRRVPFFEAAIIDARQAQVSDDT